MNKKFDSDREDALLDAILGGEAWLEAEVAGRRAALAEFRARQRRRKVRLWLAQAAAVLLLAAGVFGWPKLAKVAPLAPVATVAVNKPAMPASIGSKIMPAANTPAADLAVVPANGLPVKPESGAAAAPDKGPQYISEEELLAMFPKGSCTIAEVNGQKELIFFDQKVEKEGAVYKGGWN